MWANTGFPFWEWPATPFSVGPCTIKEDQLSVVHLAVHAAVAGKALEEGEIAFFPLVLPGKLVIGAVVHEFQPVAPGHVSGKPAKREVLPCLRLFFIAKPGGQRGRDGLDVDLVRRP